jgi:hypothetical protein
MQTSKKIDGNQNGPVLKAKIGRFQISLWRKRRVVAARKHYEAEREYVTERICIQRGRFNGRTNRWENQRIWCNPIELRDLANAMDEFEKMVVAEKG